MRRLALAVLLLTPSAAFAAEGMPQLDFGNPLVLAQVVWGAIIFFVFYLLLKRWALPQVEGVLESRAAAIAADLDTARAAKSKADEAAAEVARATASSRAEAQAAISEATTQAQLKAADGARAANERLDAQLKQAETQIAAARGSAMGALRQVASDTASTVIQRLTGTPADAQAVDGAVGAALAARGR
jgi:F-type H+-transporting ATPase subunit b